MSAEGLVMVEFVIAHNPNDRILEKARLMIRGGHLVCFPTETSWVAVCDPYNKKGVEKLYKLKGEEKSKHFSLLCPNISIATQVAMIDSSIFRQIKGRIPGAYTFIFDATKKVTKHLKASKIDHQIGLRFPPTDFCQAFLKNFDDVLLSTNITHKMLDVDDTTIDIYSYLIEESINHIVPLTIDPQDVEFIGESTIIDFTGESPVLLREGSGEVF